MLARLAYPKLLSEIFCCKDLLSQKGSTRLAYVAIKIAILDEANFYDMFKPSNQANMNFLEGKASLPEPCTTTHRLSSSAPVCLHYKQWTTCSIE